MANRIDGGSFSVGKLYKKEVHAVTRQATLTTLEEQFLTCVDTIITWLEFSAIILITEKIVGGELPAALLHLILL